MRRQDAVRQLAHLIKPYGLRIVEGPHRKIVNQQGHAIYSFAGSPGCPYFAQNTLRDLIRRGELPATLKHQKIR